MTTEEVKKALRECRLPGKCNACPLKDNDDCMTLLKWDALNVIIELEKRVHELKGRANPMKPTQNPLGEWVCKCGRVIDTIDNYCPECGRRVDWDE